MGKKYPFSTMLLWSLEEIKNKNIHNLVLCCRPFWLFALNYFFKLKSSYHIGNEKIWLDQLFTYKSFMLNEIFHHNASKFWFYYYTENNMWSISLESLGSSINLLISEECKPECSCEYNFFRSVDYIMLQRARFGYTNPIIFTYNILSHADTSIVSLVIESKGDTTWCFGHWSYSPFAFQL